MFWHRPWHLSFNGDLDLNNRIVTVSQANCGLEWLDVFSPSVSFEDSERVSWVDVKQPDHALITSGNQQTTIATETATVGHLLEPAQRLVDL